MSEGRVFESAAERIAALPPEDCPYCVAWPDEPCALHRLAAEEGPEAAAEALAAPEDEAAEHLLELLEEERHGRPDW